MEKMETVGTPLKYWDVKINRGITTGCNDAFVIDDGTKQALIAADPKSANIIKPVLRGRDTQRYRGRWAGLWIIIAKFGSYKTLPKDYPAIYQHLRSFEERLKERGQCRYTRSKKTNIKDYPGQHHWLELDNNPKDEYLELFAEEKLFWMDLTDKGRFAYVKEEIFCNNTAFTMSGKPLKYLCAVLNSNMAYWFMRNTALTSGMGTTRWVVFTVETIPIPKIAVDEQRPFIRLVDSILSAKADDPAADTGEWEEEIDKLVYELYGLTEEEVGTVEGR